MGVTVVCFCTPFANVANGFKLNVLLKAFVWPDHTGHPAGQLFYYHSPQGTQCCNDYLPSHCLNLSSLCEVGIGAFLSWFAVRWGGVSPIPMRELKALSFFFMVSPLKIN
jgi:hypothetical protein